MSRREIRFGVVGVKGFSQRHFFWINRAIAAGAPVKISAVATIFDDPETLAAGDELKKNGVKVVKEYDDLLNMHADVDVVTLPVGIHLHAPLATRALRAGFPVYMEKPAAGTVDEVAELMRAEKESGQRLLVGFQTLFQPTTWALKKRLLEGVIGKPRRIVATAGWMRPISYYHRNRWAGNIVFDGHTIYDCPMNNSSAHFLNAALFLVGPTLEASAVPTGVKTELYRSNPIGSADSDFSRFTTREGVDVVFNASQSCNEQKYANIDIVGDKGTIHIVDQEERLLAPWTITDSSGTKRSEGGELGRAELFERIGEAFANPEMREVCTIANAGMHTAANEMAFLAAKCRVHDIPEEFIDRASLDGGDELNAIRGMHDTLEALRAGGGLLPSELGTCGWARPADTLDGEPVAALLSKIVKPVA